MTPLRKIDDVLERFENRLVVFLYSALILSILFNIISRNFFHTSFAGILETSPALVLWLALVGASLCLKDNRHIKLELLLRFVPERCRTAATVLTSIFGMAVMGVLFFASFRFVKNEIMIFGAGAGFSIIFPWFFGNACFRFFIRLASLSTRPEASM